jgi:hypothetical protein
MYFNNEHNHSDTSFNFYSYFIFLYNEYLYIFNANENIISIIDTNNIKNKRIISIALNNFNGILYGSGISVNETCLYIKSSEYINVFNYNGEFIRLIDIGELDPTETFYVDSDNKIHLVQKSGNSVNFLIY